MNIMDQNMVIVAIYYEFYILDSLLVMKNNVFNLCGTVANCVT